MLSPRFTRKMISLALLSTCGAWGVACKSRSDAGLTGESKGEVDKQIAVYDLRRGASETAVQPGFIPQPVEDTYLALMQSVEALPKASSIKSVYLRLAPGAFGFARSDEVGRLFADLPDTLPVVCQAHALDNAAMMLASQACDEIWVTESGDVSTVGIAAELSYVKGTLDKVGIVADMLAMGRYKSGGEALTRTDPSEPSLANLKETLGDLRKVWLRASSKRKGVSPEHLETGPWTPARAKDKGLITHVGFPDQALASAVKRAGLTKIVKESHGSEWQDEYLSFEFGWGGAEPGQNPVAELIKSFIVGDKKEEKEDRIVVLPMQGSITMSAGNAFGGSSGITASGMTRAIRRLREDDSVRAVVIAMNSPGGSPLASDLIWRELMRTRQHKPVIVSVGGMAASGGYYIASAADKIVAAPSAIVGSIGVFGGKIVLGGAFEKLGVTHYPVPANPDPVKGARALYLSTNTAWDEPTREKMRESMQRIYDVFIDRVSEGRSMDADKVRAHAEGAIFLSGRGKSYGLIDEIGGLQKSIAIAKKMAKLPTDISVELDGEADSLLQTLFLGPQASEEQIQAALGKWQARVARAQGNLGEAQIVEKLRPFSAALAPLLEGESVVAALPYAIELH